MGTFELMRDYINSSNGPPEECINIEDVLAMSPKPPTLEMKVVKMGVFNEKVVRECILSNIRFQLQRYQKGLNRATWVKLLEFLGRDFDSVTLKTYAQVFVHFTKMRIDKDGLKEQGILEMDSVTFYDMMLSDFINGALMSITDDVVVKKIDEENATKLKQRLLPKPIRLAIIKSISVLDPNAPPVDDDYICNIINAADIYQTDCFNPFGHLRGSALHNGILICKKNLSMSPGHIKHSADLLTLATHEFAHHIIRQVFDDFNFSSPWKDHDSDQARFDFEMLNKQPLEMGRQVEVTLFDGIQPNWFNSFQLAATVFIERIDSNFLHIPVIAKDEHAKLGLIKRNPSPFFGIDVRPDMLFFE